VTRDDDHDPLLAEQVSYYRAIAGEYEDHLLPPKGYDDIVAAFEAFHPTGDVLELTCGTGMWTERLLQHATHVTAVDAAHEMIARTKARVGTERVRFIEADLFSWQPDRRYDVVFFGSWLSHVPLDRFESFWTLVASCLEADGRVFFADDNHRGPEELIEGAESPIVQRRINDGTAFRAVKVPHEPAQLQERINRLGWNVTVMPTDGPLYWGSGTRSVPTP